jgi:hypothetical protein
MATATVKIAAASSGVAPQRSGLKGLFLTQQLKVESMGLHTLLSEQLNVLASNRAAYAHPFHLRSRRLLLVFVPIRRPQHSRRERARTPLNPMPGDWN